MKNVALCCACISLILLVAKTPLHAVEQKTVFNTESMKYEAGTGSERCRDKCGRMSGPDVKSLLSQEWTIVSSIAKEVTPEQYWYVPCNTCLPHGCICIGTEYVLRRDVTPPKIEAKSEVIEAPGKETRAVAQPLKVDTSKSEIDLVRKEIDLLRQENASLRREIETLKNQLRSQLH